jgi:hypothetical protein
MEKSEEEGSSNPHPSYTLPTSRPGPRPAVTLVVTLPSLSPACRQRKEGEACTAGGALSPRRGDDSTAACRATCPCRSSGENGEGTRPSVRAGRPWPFADSSMAICRSRGRRPLATLLDAPPCVSDGTASARPAAACQSQRALFPSSAYGCRSRSSSEGERRRSWQACRLSARPSRRAGRTEPEPPPTGRLLPMAGPRLAPRASSSTSSLAFGSMLTRQPPPTDVCHREHLGRSRLSSAEPMYVRDAPHERTTRWQSSARGAPQQPTARRSQLTDHPCLSAARIITDGSSARVWTKSAAAPKLMVEDNMHMRRLGGRHAQLSPGLSSPTIQS